VVLARCHQAERRHDHEDFAHDPITHPAQPSRILRRQVR
jgi:hypothetical protein